MLEAQKQQHLRSLRRPLNRALTHLKDSGEIVFHTGWAYGRAFSHPWLQTFGSQGESLPALDGLCILLPPPNPESPLALHGLLPEGLERALSLFWPGPLQLNLRLRGQAEGLAEKIIPRALVCCPWHPLAKEVMTRNGPLFWRPLNQSELQKLESKDESLGDEGTSVKVLLWPEKESSVTPTILDVSTQPWRLVQQGFVEVEELKSRLDQAVVLSSDRAFPENRIRTYVPEGKTVVVEVDTEVPLPEVVAKLREQIPPDAFLRLYLDENTAHNHFPDDREVRVYGELSDLERVRRRLQAMLERQKRRLGKRILMIVVPKLGDGTDSFRADLEKFSDEWLPVGTLEEAKL